MLLLFSLLRSIGTVMGLRLQEKVDVGRDEARKPFRVREHKLGDEEDGG